MAIPSPTPAGAAKVERRRQMARPLLAGELTDLTLVIAINGRNRFSIAFRKLPA